MEAGTHPTQGSQGATQDQHTPHVETNKSSSELTEADPHNAPSAEDAHPNVAVNGSTPKSNPVLDDLRPKPPTRFSTASEPKKCWICYSDSTEDDSSTSRWRSPCPCALTAHESCLLDWIADIENPKNKNHNNGKIECPQCKSEIKIARPRSLVVSSLQALDRFAAKAILPGLASILVGTTWAGLWWHGLGSMYIVFGGETGSKLLQQTIKLKNWRSNGLPLIPISLIASRTKYYKLVSPFATLFLLLSQDLESTKFTHLWHSELWRSEIWIDEFWRPTASGTFACLPVFQSAYNALYRQAFGKLNKKWLAEVQPRAQENNESNEQNADDEHDMDVGDVVVDLNIEFEIGGAAHNEDVQPQVHRPPEENADTLAHEANRLLAQLDSAERPGVRPPERPGVPRQQELNTQGTGEPSPLPVQERRASQGGDPQAGPDRPRVEEQMHQADNEQAGPQNQNPNAEENVNDNGNGNNGLLQRRGEDLVLDSTSIAQTILGALVFPVVSRGMGQLLFYSLPTSLTSEPAKGVRPTLLQTRWGRTVVGGAIFVVLKDVVTTYARWRIAKGHRQRRVMDFNQSEAKN